MTRAQALDILGISSNDAADESKIKTQYRKLALKWHPDKNPDNQEEATSKFKEISNAFKVLTSPAGHPMFDGFDGDIPDLNELFQQFFEAMGDPVGDDGRTTGDNLFEAIFRGMEKGATASGKGGGFPGGGFPGGMPPPGFAGVFAGGFPTGGAGGFPGGFPPGFAQGGFPGGGFPGGGDAFGFGFGMPPRQQPAKQKPAPEFDPFGSDDKTKKARLRKAKLDRQNKQQEAEAGAEECKGKSGESSRAAERQSGETEKEKKERLAAQQSRADEAMAALLREEELSSAAKVEEEAKAELKRRAKAEKKAKAKAKAKAEAVKAAEASEAPPAPAPMKAGTEAPASQAQSKAKAKKAKASVKASSKVDEAARSSSGAALQGAVEDDVPPETVNLSEDAALKKEHGSEARGHTIPGPEAACGDGAVPAPSSGQDPSPVQQAESTAPATQARDTEERREAVMKWVSDQETTAGTSSGLRHRGKTTEGSTQQLPQEEKGSAGGSAADMDKQRGRQNADAGGVKLAMVVAIVLWLLFMVDYFMGGN
ncbi:hypothetical protein CYMTET_29090 [Cymbomonas tetramitiformis]|uniref:J domain-containing protein n=1 Tax=Cymbomonas tetramitiformis TaxID=36881 RepID=A0AAE0KVA8_9CHLO|nr:hypothetical protein CYMTET_29090 [Cymbomonas tetramitiformis]